MSIQKQRIVMGASSRARPFRGSSRTQPYYIRGCVREHPHAGFSWLLRIFTEDRHGHEDPRCHPLNSWQMPFSALPNKFTGYSLFFPLLTLSLVAWCHTAGQFRQSPHAHTRLRFIHLRASGWGCCLSCASPTRA